MGLSVSDIDNMTIGEIVDLIAYSNNLYDELQTEKVKPGVRKATQKDFDNF